MKLILVTASILSLGSAQFVFFGNRFGGPQQGRPQQPRAPFTAPAQSSIQFGTTSQRFTSRPEPVQPAAAPVTPASKAAAPALNHVKEKSPVRTDLTAEQFFGPLFRTGKKFHNPGKKDAVEPEKPEDVKFVEILTEKPVVSVTEKATTAVVRSNSITAQNGVVLPAAVVTETTPAVTTTTAASTTTTALTTTTAAPTTTTRAPTTRKVTTTTPAPSTPLKIKSFVVNSFGQPINRPTSAPAKVTPVTSAPIRQPKALEPSSRPKGNYQFEGRNYLLTWRQHRNNFDWSGGVRFCEQQGMKLISLDSKEKSEHFLRLVGQDRAPYFWAGGRLSRDGRSLSWQNGKTESVRRGQHPWSFTGRTGPQPDGGEICLAILNNVYRDGVKYHDVSCHHRKPVICEEK